MESVSATNPAITQIRRSIVSGDDETIEIELRHESKHGDTAEAQLTTNSMVQAYLECQLSSKRLTITIKGQQSRGVGPGSYGIDARIVSSSGGRTTVARGIIDVLAG